MKTVLPLVEVKNPATLEYNMLRAWMIPSLMDVLAGNKHNEYPQEIFDIGSIFKQDAKEESGILEHQRLGVVVAKDKMDYTKIKQVLEYLLRNIGIEFEVEETNHESFIEGRVGRVIVGGKKIGYVGEISPKVLDNFSLETPVGALELNLTELYEIIS
jgi:phenylalanyl-tRNA synthetase beta chain